VNRFYPGNYFDYNYAVNGGRMDKEQVTKAGVKGLSSEQKETMRAAGVSEDELKIVEAWRYIEFGKIVCYKKANALSGRIDIQTTY